MESSQDPTERFKSVANSLAMLAIAGEAYTHLDRLANALSPETVSRVIFDAQRTMSALLSRNDVKVEHKEDEKKRPFLQLTTRFKGESEKTYKFYGMPREEDTRKFLEEATKDLAIARKVAAYAVSIVANKKLRYVSNAKKGEEGD
ncbi:MAG TPA: type I-A CRISPR-associated protein Csa5 [Nitrososphaera sp.]|nr:type I-A CRISPR-associated protein Csa5 [Nitrososphaera sp.]